MNRQVQAIIEALDRQGVAADIAGLEPQMETTLATVRLRFDKVALRFVGDVTSALQDIVPDGKTLVFTIAAPIRLASKTAAALERTVRNALASRPARIEVTAAINGNRLRVRLVKGASNGPKVIGFVHNPDSDTDVLLHMTRLSLGRSTIQRGDR